MTSAQKENMEGLKGKCPAFDEKCPFDAPAATKLKEQAKNCPAFQKGCIFEKSFTIEEMFEKLSQMPALKNGTAHQKALSEILMLVHSISGELKGKFGECPKFSSKESRSFETLCADGKPLMQKLDDLNSGAVVTQSVVELKDELEKDIHDTKELKDDKRGEEKAPNGDSSIHLANELKKGTMKVHRQAERVHFVKEFIKGRVEMKIYREAVAALYYIYKALEEVSNSNANHPLFKSIHFPRELSRVESLKEDLQFYYGDDWEDEISISDAAKIYCDHIYKIGKTDPTLLISHHYTRYLGDLSGGQILKKMAVKAYQLPADGDGVRFYEFKNIPDPVEFKNAYRSRLDGLQVDQETAEKLVREAQVSFSLNIDLFKELDRLAGFEEEIVHDEVETVPNTASQGSDIKHQSGGRNAQHVTNESGVDWLKAVAAIIVTVAVLIGLVVNMMGKRE